MADIFSMTAPLTLRRPSGEERIMAEHFRHPRGLLYFDLYWHVGDPAETLHVIEGEISGEGPWRVGDCIVKVLGCHGSDPALATAYTRWQERLEQDGYLPRPLIDAIARRYGATLATNDPGSAAPSSR
jgi:hypothetical protein